MLALALDASTYAGSVAVLEGARVIAARTVAMRGAHEERLMPAVAEALSEAGVSVEELGMVICGEGPGSFTSLRIAASIAKGIAAGRGIPLAAVSSLLLTLASADVGSGRYLVLADAMRGELYAAAFAVESAAGAAIVARERLAPAVVSRDAAERLAAELDAVRVGVGQTIDVAPEARGAARLVGAEGPVRRVSLHSWEPTYGRLAEAQVKWEAAHGRPLDARG